MHWTTALLVSLSLALPAWAGEPASLSTTGKVWTNTVLLPSGATIHAGDRVETGPDSTAVISSPSTGRVEVREKSSVSLGEAELILHDGVVSTSQAVVRLGDVHIEPKASADTLIVVAYRGRRTLIAAHRGDALISRPGASSLLLAGGSYALPGHGGGQPGDPQAKAGTADEDDDDGGAATPAGSGSGGAVQTGGWTIGSLSHASSVALVAGVGAAAVAGTAAGFALTEDSPSPSTAP